MKLITRTQRARPIIVDPGLYLSKKFDVFTTTEHRELPTTFKLYTGKLFYIYYSFSYYLYLHCAEADTSIKLNMYKETMVIFSVFWSITKVYFEARSIDLFNDI